MHSVTSHPCGPNSVILFFDPTLSLEQRRCQCRAAVQALETDIRASGIQNYTPSAKGVLLEFDSPETAARETPRWMEHFENLHVLEPLESAIHELTVTYDGQDLEEVAAIHGCTRSEVIRWHSDVVYEVEMIGFSPGFPYLAGLDPRLFTPRRATPRPHIAAGSVAIGGTHTGIYSVKSPGGWNLIGHTDAVLFDPARGANAFLLKTGDRVRFIPHNLN